MQFAKASGQRLRNEVELRRRLHWRELALASLIALSLAIFGFFGFFAQHGVPVLRHDWAWPVDDVELRSFYSAIASPWNLGGAGAPSVYPAMYALAWCMSAMGRVLETKNVLDVLLVSTFLAGFLGVYVIARVDGARQLSALGACIAATTYAVSPFFLNKFIAGHYLNLVGYALFPILAALAISIEAKVSKESFFARAIFSGLIVGFSAVQIEYLAFDALLLLLLCVTSANVRRMTGFSFIAIAIGAVTQSFSLSNLLLPATAAVSLPSQVPLQWFRNMSVEPRLGLVGYGYAIDYARQTFAWDQAAIVWQATGFAALAPIGITLFARRAVRWPLVCLVGVFCASGTVGPAAELKAWLFARFVALGVFRELYNFTCLTSLGLALCVGTAVDWLVIRATRASMLYARVGLGILTLFTVSVIGYPFAFHRTLGFLYLWRPSANFERLASRLTDRSARIEFLPAAQPLHSDNTEDGFFPFAGTDMWEYQFRGHPVAFDYVPTGPIALGLSALGHEDYAYAARIFGLVGTRYIIARRGMQSYLPRYWFARVFPATWETGSSLGGMRSGKSAFKLMESNSDFDLYENAEYHPILSVAEETLVCDRSEVYQAVFGDVTGCKKGPAVTPSIRVLPMPDDDTYGPFDGWVSAQPFFMVKESVAEHSQSIFTESMRPHVDRFSVRERLFLFASCQAALPATLVIDGRLRRVLRCSPFGSRTDRWERVARLESGMHVVVTEKLPGSMLLNPLIGYRASDGLRGPVDPAEVAVLGRPGSEVGASGNAVLFKRTTPGVITGTVTCALDCVLVQEETFNPHWRLRLEGSPEIPSTRINLTQNGFRVRAGVHRFSLSFELPALNRLALVVGNYSWLVVGLAALIFFGLSSLRSNRMKAAPIDNCLSASSS
ncbi:MAG: hypothetical protein WAN59_15150 [Candidatus Baltobacteraceae bacterium]